METWVNNHHYYYHFHSAYSPQKLSSITPTLQKYKFSKKNFYEKWAFLDLGFVETLTITIINSISITPIHYNNPVPYRSLSKIPDFSKNSNEEWALLDFGFVDTWLTITKTNLHKNHNARVPKKNFSQTIWTCGEYALWDLG